MIKENKNTTIMVSKNVKNKLLRIKMKFPKLSNMDKVINYVLQNYDKKTPQ
jgi:hypothetical protein